MKSILAFLALTVAMLAAVPSAHAVGGFSNEPFQKVFYFEHGGKGHLSGLDAGNAKAISSADVMALEAGMVIEKVYVVVDTAIAGSSAVNVGDDDSSNGYVPTAAITLGTPGMYGWDAKAAGSYQRIQTAGATDAGDIYVVPNAKYYSAAKTLKLAVTGASSAGKFRIVVKGHKIGANS